MYDFVGDIKCNNRGYIRPLNYCSILWEACNQLNSNQNLRKYPVAKKLLLALETSFFIPHPEFVVWQDFYQFWPDEETQYGKVKVTLKSKTERSSYNGYKFSIIGEAVVSVRAKKYH